MQTLIEKMNSQVKTKWVDALRSGEYEQGNGKLRSREGFCCLGVLCDLYSKEKNAEWEFWGNNESVLHPSGYWYFENESEFLPQSVMEWAEMTSNNPQVRVYVSPEDVQDEDELYYNDEITNVNDSGYTFEQLSDIIEHQF